MSEQETGAAPNVLSQLFDFWRALSGRRRAIIVGSALVTVLAVAFAASRGGDGPYSTLYSGLAAEDAGDIVAALDGRGIRHRLAQNGTAIEVPEAKVHEVRLAIASAGLPRGGGVGFEIFDEQSFGTTSFVEQVNYRRALQGELARSIGSLAAVESARVHVAMGQRSVFKDADEPPTASVALKLRSGRRLSDDQVAGIVHLVASSVDGLLAEEVVVIDDHGKVLSQSADDKKGHLSDVKSDLEETLTRRVQGMLDRVVGPGHAAVVVTAEMDYRQIDQTEELYEKDAVAIRSEVRTMEGDELPTPAAASGVAGVRGNLPGTGEVTAVNTGAIKRMSETRNYEVPKVVRRTVEPASRIRKLHVAVLVDHKQVAQEAGDATAPTAGSAAADEEPETTDTKDENPAKEEGKDGEVATSDPAQPEMMAVPRTEKELAEIAAIVREAAGLEESRGDRLEVRNIPFAETQPVTEEVAPEISTPPWWLKDKYIVAAAAGLGLIVLLIAFLTIKKSAKRAGPMAALRGQVMPLPAPISEVEAQLNQQSANPALAANHMHQLRAGDDVYGRVVAAVRSDTVKAAKALSALLEEDDKNTKRRAL